MAKAIIKTICIQRIVQQEGKPPQISVKDFEVIHQCVFETIGEPQVYLWGEEMNYADYPDDNRKIPSHFLQEASKSISSSTVCVSKPHSKIPNNASQKSSSIPQKNPEHYENYPDYDTSSSSKNYSNDQASSNYPYPKFLKISQLTPFMEDVSIRVILQV